MKNKITTTLDKIVAEDALKESTKLYLQSKMAKEKKVFKFTFKKFATTFACLFIIVIASTLTAYFTVTSSISIDINPSFEVGVNFLDRVVKVTAYNDDAKNAKKSLSLNNMKYLDAINAIMVRTNLKEYIKDDSFISVSVTANNNTKTSKMVDCISTESSYNKSLHCYSVNSSLSKEAHKNGLSFGKYRAYLELVALNPDIKIEDIKNLSMRKIQDMIESEKGNFPTINSDNKETSNAKPHDNVSNNGENSSNNDDKSNNKESHKGQGNNSIHESQSNANSAQNDDKNPNQNSNQQNNNKPFSGNGNHNGNTNSENKTETNSNVNSENTGESGATSGDSKGNGNGYGNGNGNKNIGIGKNGNGNGNKNND
ncbi:MAG: hypothetical protein RR073_03875 [Clostridia bacterium]